MSVILVTSPQLLPMSDKTPRMIGREEELVRLEKYLHDRNASHFCCYWAGGGLGKTRLVQELQRLVQEAGMGFYTTGILDLYHTDLHGISDIAGLLNRRGNLRNGLVVFAVRPVAKLADRDPDPPARLRAQIGGDYEWELYHFEGALSLVTAVGKASVLDRTRPVRFLHDEMYRLIRHLWDEPGRVGSCPEVGLGLYSRDKEHCFDNIQRRRHAWVSIDLADERTVRDDARVRPKRLHGRGIETVCAAFYILCWTCFRQAMVGNRQVPLACTPSPTGSPQRSEDYGY